MAAKGLVLYLITGFFSAVTYAYYIHHYSLHDVVSEQSVLSSSNSRVLQQRYRSEAKIWPELKFGWEIVVATAIGFLGSACGTVGGVGGGGIFVPTLTLIVGFDTKSAAAISKFLGATKTSCMIMGASASSFWYNLRVPHPCRQVAIIDYDLALLFQPMLMLGITFGVSLSVVFPHWLITVLIIILFLGTSSRSFAKAIMMWKDETILKKAMEEEKQQTIGQVLIDAEYEPLVPPEEKTTLQIIKANLNTSRISVLLLVWIGFLLLQVIKNDTKACSPFYWVLNFLQLPVALSIFAFECVRLYRESKKRRIAGNQELICEAAIEWTATNLAFCALCGLLGGTVGGLLGSGGGFILGPLLLEIGVIPQVASATATFVMMFSSSLSVVEFYLLKRFPMHYALYMMTVSILAGFWGQFVVRKLVTILKRASIIVFILSAVIFASAVIMGIDGIEKSIQMISNHEFMGFLDFCSSQ